MIKILLWETKYFYSWFAQYFENFHKTITKHVETKNWSFVNVTTCFKAMF